jgi:hypothetical protein
VQTAGGCHAGVSLGHQTEPDSCAQQVPATLGCQVQAKLTAGCDSSAGTGKDRSGSCAIAAIKSAVTVVAADDPAGQLHVMLLSGSDTIPSEGAQGAASSASGEVTAGRMAWLWVDPGMSAAELASEIIAIVHLMLPPLPDAATALPLSAASEVTAVFTLASEDAAAINTWDLRPWLPVRLRIMAGTRVQIWFHDTRFGSKRCAPYQSRLVCAAAGRLTCLAAGHRRGMLLRSGSRRSSHCGPRATCDCTLQHGYHL